MGFLLEFSFFKQEQSISANPKRVRGDWEVFEFIFLIIFIVGFTLYINGF